MKRALLSSSPLFDHEMSPYAKRAKLDSNALKDDEKSTKQNFSSTEINSDDVFGFTPPKRVQNIEISNEVTDSASKSTGKSTKKVTEKVLNAPNKPISASIKHTVTQPTDPTPIDVPIDVPIDPPTPIDTPASCAPVSFDMPTQIDSPAHTDSPGQIDARALETQVDAPTAGMKKRTKFKSPKKSQPSKPGKKSQPAPIMTRLKAGNCVRCVLYDPAEKWLTPIEQALQELNCEAQLRRESRALPDGVELVMRAYGDFADEWDDEQQTFLKSSTGEVDLHAAFVVISSAQFEAIAAMSVDARAKYFNDVRQCVGELDSLIFFFPEFSQHYKKQLDRYNREMRKRVNTDDTTKLASLPPLVPPPCEESYTNVQTELEVFNEIRAVYPRKTQDAVELLANSAVEAGYKRYSHKLDEIKVPSGGSVRSKTTPNEVSIECLTKVPGLPPRIARKLVEEAGVIGSIKNYLGTHEAMRASRLKHFGKGSWNDALMAVMEDCDPLKTLGA